MGRPEIKVPDHPFVYGGDKERLCRDCQLPCKLEVTSVDCFRRFVLQGMLQCTYFVHGYCFLADSPGCVLDNDGDHDRYWLGILKEYFHNVGNGGGEDPAFARRRGQLDKLIEEQIENGSVSLCRYIEEFYHRVMEDGGGMSEDVMEKLDEAYLALLSGTQRKR